MAIQELPPKTPVDSRCAGVLRMTPEFIELILRLPAGCRIVGIDAATDDCTVGFLINGAPMPERVGGEKPADVSIVCRVERVGDTETVFAKWKHDPGHEWVVLRRQV